MSGSRDGRSAAIKGTKAAGRGRKRAASCDGWTGREMRLEGLDAVLAFGMELAESSRLRKGANCGVTVWRRRTELGAEASGVETLWRPDLGQKMI
jgi:hypothetical protein